MAKKIKKEMTKGELKLAAILKEEKIKEKRWEEGYKLDEKYRPFAERNICPECGENPRYCVDMSGYPDYWFNFFIVCECGFKHLTINKRKFGFVMEDIIEYEIKKLEKKNIEDENKIIEEEKNEGKNINQKGSNCNSWLARLNRLYRRALGETV